MYLNKVLRVSYISYSERFSEYKTTKWQPRFFTSVPAIQARRHPPQYFKALSSVQLITIFFHLASGCTDTKNLSTFEISRFPTLLSRISHVHVTRWMRMSPTLALVWRPLVVKWVNIVLTLIFCLHSLCLTLHLHLFIGPLCLYWWLLGLWWQPLHAARYPGWQG
jgi:hypothetical protein